MLQLLDTNPDKILKEMISIMEDKYKVKIYEGDQRYIFISSIAYIISLERVRANLAFNQNFLSEAYGIALDQKGIDLNTPRLDANYSEVDCKFILSKSQNIDYKIPKGTRVSTMDNQMFETIDDLIISNNDIEGVVKCRASLPGALYNNIDIGLINRFVDILPYLDSVSNINKSSGGSNVEDDESYRARLKIAEAQYSTAGPILAYKYWALKSDADISDVLITTPEPGVVEIKPVLKTGDLPTEVNINRIKDMFDKTKNYPNTTTLRVVIPDTYSFNIDLNYYIKDTDKMYEKEIQDKVNTAIDEFIMYQKMNINIYLNPDDLRKRILNAGAYIVNIKEPVFTKENVGKVLVMGDKTIKYGGLV